MNYDYITEYAQKDDLFAYGMAIIDAFAIDESLSQEQKKRGQATLN